MVTDRMGIEITPKEIDMTPRIKTCEKEVKQIR